MKNNNLKEFVDGLKKVENPDKINNELNKIRSLLNNPNKTIKENILLDLKPLINNDIQKLELKKIKDILKVQ